MRNFFTLLLVLAASTVGIAQQSPARPNDAKAILNTIDSLNKLSYDTFLQSPDSARKAASKALLLAEKAKYPLGIGNSFYNIGHIYWSQSYYPIALVYLNKALLNIPAHENKLIAKCFITIGRSYSDLHNFRQARRFLDSAERIAHGDLDEIADVFSERSLIYRREHNFEEALAEAQKALNLNKIVHDRANAAVLYERIAVVFNKTGRYKEALAYADTAYKLSFIVHNKRLRANVLVVYASIYNNLGDFDKAIPFAKSGGNLADSIGVVDVISGAYKELISSYEKKHDLQTTMFYLKRYNKMQDSLSTFNKNKNTELIQEYFALDRRLTEMAALERADMQHKALLKSQSYTIITLTLALALVLVLFVVTYYFYKQRKNLSEQLRRQHDALLEQKQLIESQTADLELLSGIKDKLLAVIAHDLRTPLANLRNITDMFGMDYFSNEEIHKLMQEISPMVKSAEMTLSNLLEWAGSNIKGRKLNAGSLDIFLAGVEMEEIFGHALQKKNIEFRNQASPGQSVFADENHIKVVLRNLVSNAIKFTEAKGYVVLSSELTKEKVIICVEDSGKGMFPEEIEKLFSLQTHFSQRGTAGETGTGIGLMLCKELVELNGGNLWIESKPGRGSKFYFCLPLNPEYV